ncbi:Major facilitator superfamily transporter [Akanthomyces lecanii RCEF 1005]|uniref:Major facilitator superfamily transporter n=1 Tax=Akanthomyces lecanii RCEF 1005 TaxID=1081108 RepID=A0A162KW35_CORDF|nr:Major facilitator superfamily transporter [Akanthomyces lecanii RCEF 1005]
MSDEHKETVVEHSADSKEFAHSVDDVYNGSTGGSPARPAGWMYKGYTPFGRKFELWYASPKVQLLMISMVCFLCPGMFNALNGLGGGGLPDDKAYVGANCNVALYSTFAVFGFFAGTITNRLGLRPALAFGGVGYCLYAASFLSYKHTANEGFVYFAGAFLGVCAGILWCAQGAIMMAYPREEVKGRYISVFWIIFNFGGVIGSLIPLAQAANDKFSNQASDGVYIAFIILMVIGAALSFCLCNADKVVREDGSKVIIMKNPTWASELKGLWETLYQQPWILLLFPMFFCSNIFYTYQNNGVNAVAFNARTRALNGLLYWLAQIVAAVINGFALDYKGLSRSTRARLSLAFLIACTFGIWGGGWAWQKDQPTREYYKDHKDQAKLDWADGGKFLGPMFLYFFYGMYDAIWQTSIYWYMGALSNSGRKAANLAGFYKGIQSAGAAIFWRLDGMQLPFDTIFGATWGCLAASLLIAAPVIVMRIQDHVSVEEDLKFSDETIEDVTVVPEKRIDGEA